MSTTTTPVNMSDQIASVKASYPTISMTDADAKKFINQRAGWFKGSIAVCCIYGIFALGLLLVSIFSEAGKLVLSGYLMPFTTTLIGGMLFIVLLLVIQITTFKPSITDTNTYDGDICPDYWQIEKLSESDLNNMSGNGINQKNNYLMKYRCKPNTDIYSFYVKKGSTQNVYGQNINTIQPLGFGRYFKNNNANLNQVKNPVTSYLYTNFTQQNGGGKPATFNATTNVANDTNATLNCDVVYPNLLSMLDQTKFPDTPNALRCAYARQCGIPWSGVCPNPPSTDT